MHVKIPLILIALLAVGCGGQKKPAENPDQRTTGEKVDDATKNAEDSAEKATERAGEAAEDAGDKAKAKTKDED